MVSCAVISVHWLHGVSSKFSDWYSESVHIIFAVQTQKQLSNSDIKKLSWLFGNSCLVDSDVIKKTYLGPRAVMVSPWSTNAVEMTQNMGINHINRIEKYVNGKWLWIQITNRHRSNS